MTTETQGIFAMPDDLGTVATSLPSIQRRPVALASESRRTHTDLQCDVTTPATAEISHSADGPTVPRDRVATLFELLQKWEGVVQACSNVDFTAVLHDVTDRSRPELEATFELNEVSAGDLPLVVPGAVFRYQIGYETVRGTKRTISELQFKRIPPPTRAERIRARRDAAQLMELLSE